MTRPARKLFPAARQTLFTELPAGGTLLDIGCLGFAQLRAARDAGRDDIEHWGVDYAAAATKIPPDFHFVETDLRAGALPFADDTFDAVVASHVIEHVPDPVALIIECVRVCKPGGQVYVECPSERSLLVPGVPFRHDLFCSFSFYDDPTHVSRPWTPQSLYRLACYLGCTPRVADYVTSWKHRLAFPLLFPWLLIRRNVVMLEQLLWLTVGWSSVLLMRKPADLVGKPEFRYYIPPRPGSRGMPAPPEPARTDRK